MQLGRCRPGFLSGEGKRKLFCEKLHSGKYITHPDRTAHRSRAPAGICSKIHCQQEFSTIRWANDNPATGAPYKRKNRYLWRNCIG
jgi:hypothetical protein